MILDSLDTLDEMLMHVAERFKKIRKSKKITQQQLSLTSNVSYGTIKRLETTGEISLISLAKLCDALGIRYEISNLFKNVYYKNIDEVPDNE